MTHQHQPGHIVYSNGKAYHITSAGDYVPHDPAKYQAARERAGWSRKVAVDRREMVV